MYFILLIDVIGMCDRLSIVVFLKIGNVYEIVFL